MDKYKLKDVYVILNERIQNALERHVCTGAERAVQMCISVRIHQSLASFSSHSHRLQ